MKKDYPIKNLKVQPLESDPVIRLNWLDKSIGFFSPKALLRRKKYKLYNSFLSRKYEGASVGRRTSGWHTANASANSELSLALPRLRDRSRDLVRNNPYAARGIQVISNNVVGRGIKTQLKIDQKSTNSNREVFLNNTWRAWANTHAIDFDGVHTFSGLQRLAMRAVAESGECFIRLRRSKKMEAFGPDGKLYAVPPIQLQILESDFLATSRISKTLDNGNNIIEGIEFDKQGKRVAYHLFQEHPGSFNFSIINNNIQTIRVPVDEILHLYRMDRPGQNRGQPWLSNVMLRLRDFDLYEDAQLKRQQCAAMFTAFIHDLEGIDDDTEEKEEIEIGEKMEPGLMEILPPGKDIKLSNPPGADNYDEYTSVVLHSIASGLGITYESLTGNLKEVNFSSARMGFLEMQRNIETWRSDIMISKFLTPTFNWFKTGLELIGENTDSIRGVFTPPKREMIDPVKEINAAKTAVRCGFKTLSDTVREMGSDPDNHFEEIGQDNETLDRLKLILDSDPRNMQNNTNISKENKNG